MEYSKTEIRKISDLTSNFYKENSKSFSKTRGSAWKGWDKALPYIQAYIKKESKSTINYTDFACGNLRFEQYLSKHITGKTFNVFAIDNCIDLLPQTTPNNMHINFVNFDIIDALIDKSLEEKLTNVDFAVCFGLMHHIPSYNLRLNLLSALFDKIAKGGILIVSFWQFLNSERLSKKAQKATKIAISKYGFDYLLENDYFLQWQNRNDTFRFCHHFTDHEIYKLCTDLNAKILDSYIADGTSNNLNKYIIFSKH